MPGTIVQAPRWPAPCPGPTLIAKTTADNRQLRQQTPRRTWIDPACEKPLDALQGRALLWLLRGAHRRGEAVRVGASAPLARLLEAPRALREGMPALVAEHPLSYNTQTGDGGRGTKGRGGG